MEEGKLKEIEVPVKYLAAVLLSRGYDPGRELYPRLESEFGNIDFEGPARPFDLTDYYRGEMGPGLSRRIVSFEGLGSASRLAEKKMLSREIEREMSEGGSRRANIDTGYIDFFKVVLASFKEGPQKIYLRRGVYADMVLMYQDGGFITLPWTFPDIKTGRYMEEFTEIRRRFRDELRGG